MTITDAELAYIAGIIDGEGCITIQKSLKKRCNHASYQAHVVVCMTSNAVIQHLVDTVHGGWRTLQQQRAHCRPIYRFVVTGTNAYNLIEAIAPYLVEKREQAKKLLELRQYCKGQGVRPTAEELREKDAIFVSLKAMHLWSWVIVAVDWPG